KRLNHPSPRHSATACPTTKEFMVSTKPNQKGGELTKWAGILCNDPNFWKWLETKGWSPYRFDSFTSGEIVRTICGVQSRRELDHNPAAARIFREAIMRPFDEWKRCQKF
ncbi:MAG: hypothetical protein KGI54_17520, partial [Pseudomonadota bacterium]|nr:hypothetical protein [Pseudomonadota bacterium]